MEEVLKRFTLIDLLGIFVPGALMTLALNFYGFDLTVPFNNFFGENAVMLVLYFLALSYLVGSALHQLGAFMEHIPYGRPDHREYQEKEEIKKAYRRCFGTDIPQDAQSAWRYILCYSQRNGRPERVVLFNSFYTMSRTSAVTLICIFPIVLLHLPDNLHLLQILLGSLIYVGVIVIFLLRWRRFEKTYVEEVYILFSLQGLKSDRSSETDR